MLPQQRSRTGKALRLLTLSVNCAGLHGLASVRIFIVNSNFMGLNVQLTVNNRENVFTLDYFENPDIGSFHKHNLSRTFCNFMCKQHAVGGEPELDQIGRITGVDITPLYDMERYWDKDSVEHQLSFAETEGEKEEVLKRINADKAKLETNIDAVYATVNALIENYQLYQTFLNC